MTFVSWCQLQGVGDWLLGARLPQKRAVFLQKPQERGAAGLVTAVSTCAREMVKVPTDASVEPNNDFLLSLVLLVGGGEEPKIQVIPLVRLAANGQLAGVRLADIKADVRETSAVYSKL